MTTRSCDQLRDLLSESRTDTDRLAEDIAAHLAACAICCAAEAELSELLANYGQSPPSPLRDDLTTRLLDRLCLKLRPQGI